MIMFEAARPYLSGGRIKATSSASWVATFRSVYSKLRIAYTWADALSGRPLRIARMHCLYASPGARGLDGSGSEIVVMCRDVIALLGSSEQMF